MASGGSRPGAGRPRLTDAEKAERIAARKAARKAAAKTKSTPKKAKPARVGHSPTGVKEPGTPAGWPFGTEAPAPAQPPAASGADGDGEPVIAGGEPLEFLQAVINETRLKLAVRMQAAALAVAYKHAKPAPMGKKEGRADAARKVSKFATAAPPKLVVNNRS